MKYSEVRYAGKDSRWGDGGNIFASRDIMPDTDSNKVCPECGRFISRTALQCRYCQFTFERKGRISTTDWVGAILLLAVGATLSAVAPKVWDAFTDPLSETTVHFMAPWNMSRGSPNVRIVAKHPAHCIDSLKSGDPGAVRCFTTDDSSLVYDPCWPGMLEAAVCFSSPWDRYATMVTPIEIDRSPRDDEKIDLKPPTVWALELSNGDRCTFIAGATRVVAGMRLNYECDDGGRILGDLDQQDKVWKVFLNEKNSSEVLQIAVRQVWV